MADATRRSTRFSMRSKQLGQLLLENGDVQAENVAKALKIQEQQGGMIGLILREQGACDENVLAAALLKQVQVTDVRCDELGVPAEVAQLVSRETCETEKLCPFERLGNLLCIVMGNPLNRRAITQIEESTHLKVKSFKSVWPKINELIQRTYAEENMAPAEGDAGEMTVIDPGAPEDAGGLVLEDAGGTPDFANANDPVELAPPDFGDLTQEDPAPIAVARHSAKPRAGSSEPRIHGIDNLNDDQAEMIETNRRGLTKRTARPDDEPVKVKPEKKAKVNVDLDALDLSSGEVVRGPDDAPEGMEEIAVTPFVNKPLQRHAGAVVALKGMSDGYFYADGKAPKGKRGEDLSALIDSIPVGETVAQSIGEYEEQQAAKEKSKPVEKPVLKPVSASAAAVIAKRPLELQPAPAETVTAVLISEVEFKKLTATLGEDPIGEWDWHFAAQGPVPVHAYEEN